MKSISITSAMLLTLSLAQAAVRTPNSIAVADLAKETLAKKTLQQVAVSAGMAANQANQLEMIARPESSPESHLAKLAVLKDEANRMGQEMCSIKEDAKSLPPWEQQAIDKVLPLLQATAADTGNAIAYFNENKHSLWVETYRNYADSVRQDSARIAKTLKDYLKYDKLPLRANIDETILPVVITEQGENRNQCEEQWNLFGFPDGFARRGA